MKRKQIITIAAGICLIAGSSRADLVTNPNQIANATVDNFDQFATNPPLCPSGTCERGFTDPINVGNGVILTGGAYPYGYDFSTGEFSSRYNWTYGKEPGGAFATVGPDDSYGTFTFPKPVSAFGFFVKTALGAESFNAYDSVGNLVGSYSPELQFPDQFPFPGDSEPNLGYFFGVASSSANIASVSFSGLNSGILVDDLTFGDNAALAEATPEPGTLGLLLVCGGCLLVIARAKHRTA